MSRLALLILLSFGSLIAACFALWSLLTVGTRARRLEQAFAARPEPTPRHTTLSNDVLRGAKAPRKNPPIDPEALPTIKDAQARPTGDPFERFLDPKRDRDGF